MEAEWSERLSGVLSDSRARASKQRVALMMDGELLGFRPMDSLWHAERPFRLDAPNNAKTRGGRNVWSVTENTGTWCRDVSAVFQSGPIPVALRVGEITAISPRICPIRYGIAQHSGEYDDDHGIKTSHPVWPPNSTFCVVFAEMWERFSYYGMRALLVFYMIKGFLGYNDGEAYRVYGAYAGLVYMTPFIGGMIADRLIGARRAVVLGGVLMSLGHLVMTFESAITFYMALALLIVGNGFFKPNISTMVGDLYGEHDPSVIADLRSFTWGSI